MLRTSLSGDRRTRREKTSVVDTHVRSKQPTEQHGQSARRRPASKLHAPLSLSPTRVVGHFRSITDNNSSTLTPVHSVFANYCSVDPASNCSRPGLCEYKHFADQVLSSISYPVYSSSWLIPEVVIKYRVVQNKPTPASAFKSVA